MREPLLPTLLLGLILLMTARQSLAQQMYKCGNTYSQTPCDTTTAPVRVFSDAKPSPAAALRGKDLCKAATPRAANLKDPYSARVETVGGPYPEVVTFANEPLMVKRYDVAMNAKNSFGAYTGAKMYGCYLTEDEVRVFKIDLPASEK